MDSVFEKEVWKAHPIVFGSKLIQTVERHEVRC